MKNHDWNSYERAANKGPVSFGVKLIVGIALLAALIGVVGFGFGLIGEAATVAQQELGAKAVLQKYEWFKDAAAQLDRKQADLKMYDERLERLHKTGNEDAIGQAEAERLGVASSYNDLAARYNAAMAKINWRFANAGDVPEGGEALPREFRRYEGSKE